VRLLVFAHVDGDQVLLTPVQGLGQGQRGLGLAHAEVPASMKTPIGLLGLSSPAREVWMRLAIISMA
jgi:hypothetical protein